MKSVKFTIVYGIIFLIATCLIQYLLSCPSDKWVYCADDDQDCVIPALLNATTVAYGAPSTGIWTFMEIQNTATPPQDFTVYCCSQCFGDPDYDVSKICCYNPVGNTISVAGEFHNEENWVQKGNYEEPQFNVPYVNGLSRWVRYGFGGQYFFRLFSYEVECTGTVFPWINDNEDNLSKSMCWYSKTVYDNQTKYIPCGSSSTKNCNLEVDTNDTGYIRLVKYGNNGAANYGYKDQFYYRFVYSQTGNIQCDEHLFGDNDSGDPVECYVMSIKDSNLFVNATGHWYQVGFCSDCVLSMSLEFGVTSTSQYSKTSTWSEELQQTVEYGLLFAKYAVSYSVGYEISTAMSETFEVSVSKTCKATCGSQNGTYYMYQWLLTVAEIINQDVTPFKAFSCAFICTTSPAFVPRCPLDACKNANCTVCSPWKA